MAGQGIDIGFVGVGVMGAPMARHLAAAGHRLRVHDADAAAAQRVAALIGAQVADTPAALAAGCDVVVTMLPNGQVVQQVALGERGLVEGLKPGALLIDTSSSEPR